MPRGKTQKGRRWPPEALTMATLLWKHYQADLRPEAAYQRAVEEVQKTRLRKKPRH